MYFVRKPTNDVKFLPPFMIYENILTLQFFLKLSC